jgi:hypothetical protein
MASQEVVHEYDTNDHTSCAFLSHPNYYCLSWSGHCGHSLHLYCGGRHWNC